MNTFFSLISPLALLFVSVTSLTQTFKIKGEITDTARAGTMIVVNSRIMFIYVAS
jgi:hypothetical protein